MSYVALYSHAECACEGLEYTLNLVMLIGAVCLNVKIHPCCVTETLEEVQEHLSGHFAYSLAVELCIPVEPWPAAKVKCYLASAVVHGQAKAVTFDSALGTEAFVDTLPYHYCRVLNGVMLVNMYVAVALHAHIYIPMTCNLLKHVVEKTELCMYVAFPRAIKIHAYLNVGLLGLAAYRGSAFAGKQQFGNLVPRHAVASD